jgi:hypothetical protein
MRVNVSDSECVTVTVSERLWWPLTTAPNSHVPVGTMQWVIEPFQALCRLIIGFNWVYLGRTVNWVVGNVVGGGGEERWWTDVPAFARKGANKAAATSKPFAHNKTTRNHWWLGLGTAKNCSKNDFDEEKSKHQKLPIFVRLQGKLNHFNATDMKWTKNNLKIKQGLK